ncbi:MAG: hypothetical protein IJO64_04480 [Clostridia bacterium]|nr:hypothetical protein [Clostridia bacterium]
MGAWVFVIIFAFAVFIVLGNVIPMYKEHKKIVETFVNYDPMMRRYVYKVNLTSDEILKRLSVNNDADDLSCKLDSERSEIILLNTVFRFHIHEYKEFSVVTLERVSLSARDNIPIKLNPFMINKLEAIIIPYSESYF